MSSNCGLELDGITASKKGNLWTSQSLFDAENYTVQDRTSIFQFTGKR